MATTPATPTYEQARDELASVVASLEAGGHTLEVSLRLWERGEELAAVCQAWLEAARERVEASEVQADVSSPS
jgi:exodeoxyribonuclease VII small subunit